MNEQLISFETAKLAKGKGFGVDRHRNVHYDGFYYDSNGELVEAIGSTSVYDERSSAPTQSLLKKWLRETHDIDVSTTPSAVNDLYDKNSSLEKLYTCRVDNWKLHWSVHHGTELLHPEHYHFEHKIYEEALELGLKKALKLIQNENE